MAASAAIARGTFHARANGAPGKLIMVFFSRLNFVNDIGLLAQKKTLTISLGGAYVPPKKVVAKLR